MTILRRMLRDLDVVRWPLFVLIGFILSAVCIFGCDRANPDACPAPNACLAADTYATCIDAVNGTTETQQELHRLRARVAKAITCISQSHYDYLLNDTTECLLCVEQQTCFAIGFDHACRPACLRGDAGP